MENGTVSVSKNLFKTGCQGHRIFYFYMKIVEIIRVYTKESTTNTEAKYCNKTVKTKFSNT